MFDKKSKEIIRLEPQEYKTVFKRNKLLKTWTCDKRISGCLNVCFLIMSLIVVQASALTIFPHRSAASTTATAYDQQIDSSNQLSHFQATTSEFITANPKINELTLNFDTQPNKENLTITNHILRTNIIVGAGGGGVGATDFKQNFDKPTENMRAKLQQLLQRENDNDEEEKQQLQQDLQQQQQRQLYQQSQHAMLTGENAYLLERIDDGDGVGSVSVGGSMHEQPIYGTWNAKARRPQAPLLTATATTTTTTKTAGAAAITHSQPSSSIKTLITEVDENLYGRHNNKHHQQQLQQHHHYERLPKRSSTMTPVRRELHDQIPRPPRLTSRQPSVALRRQYSDAPLPLSTFRDESRPKPFHYPFDGPLPEEFKKMQQSERAVGLDMDTQVHNIQDILQKLNLGTPMTSKVPPLMMMPTGLHISGSYKNLKSSGIGNFFRGKRNKKQIQMQFPMPIPMQMIPNPYQTPIIMQQPYQQRIAMEQFYPFKARSPGDINLLAMQQQHSQTKYKNHHTKGKKQKKKQKDKKNSSSNVMMQQYPFVTAAPEMVFPSMYSPFMSINVTQTPPLQMSKRVPFKVNLDIFPVMPPSKNHKPSNGYAMDEARMVSTMRAPTVLRNPFMEYYTTPMTPSAAATALNFYNPYGQKQPLYNSIRFPTTVPNPVVNMAQTNSMQMIYPEQMQKYLQQQQQQQQQNLFNNFLNSQGHQTPFLPIDCEPENLASSSQSSSGNPKTNPIMVHLNVFPKQKPTIPHSTNPFYNNVPQIQRNTIQEESESSMSPIEPRHKGRSLNDSTLTLTKIERSDSTDSIQHIQPIRDEDDLVDFNHPIVAENLDDNSELPQPSALVADKTNINTESSSSSFYYESRPNNTLTSVPADKTKTNNYNGNVNGNMEQMVSEAKTASLFRFPVEDLIQFQVNDAM